MNPDILRDRFSPVLESLRWLFVALPLAGMVPALTPVTGAVAAAAFLSSLPLLWLPAWPPWVLPVSLTVLAASSGTLWVLQPHGLTSVVPFTTVFYAARFLTARAGLGVAVSVIAMLVVLYVRDETNIHSALLNVTMVGVVMLLGLNRRSRAERMEQTELALARARTAAEEHALAAALAERARIARDLHDVLAHSLSGLALNLQGARLMLLRDGANPEVLAQIERAQRLASDGLTEARRAVAALREDPVPLERAIADLLTGYRLDSGAAAELTVQGSPRPVGAAPATTVLRTVQEALSNTRKHAPGASVHVALSFSEDGIEVTVTDHQGRAPAPADTAGYGLRGMAERADLLGGRLSTGPGEDGWRVRLALPA
ncbi:histidine kinase [Amycolatopsis cynarae]|uniref:histidine kinase n=1 Tax=Amycolatopsis cynarae TaxID=2995223 RepID=A0ABY7B9P2_9PSEU|nr:histidine kinase [Amycolatopsis sp. HUAS 11-8]WAL67433.1 histidine kinase [Amycolatopsis sp. HUAS 11-8]